MDGKLTAAEVRAASDTNSFTQKAHTSREQNCEPKRKQNQDSCKDNGVAAEVGAAIDKNSFIQNAHTQDIDTQDLCAQNTGTKTTSLVRTRAVENRTKKWLARAGKQRTEQNLTDKRHLQKAEPGVEASEREDSRRTEKEDNPKKKNANET